MHRIVSTYTGPLPPPTGRPESRPSAALATKAWVRRLLDELPTMRGHALNPSGKPVSWSAFTTAQLDDLRRHFQNSDAAASLGTPRALDALLPFLEPKGTGSNPFEKNYAYGNATPNPAVLALMEQTSPGSLEAYRTPPRPFDAALYNALDYTNPWWARALLIGRIQPGAFDSWPGTTQGDEVDPSVELAQLNDPRVLQERWELGNPHGETVFRLSSEVIEATACALYPGEAHHGGDALSDVLHHLNEQRARATPNQLPQFPQLTEGGAWALLAEAVSAYRLTNLYLLSDDARWHASFWLNAVLRTVEPTLDDVDRRCFYRAPRQPLASLRIALEQAGCWEPSLPD